MSKTILLVIMLFIVAFFVIAGLLTLLKHAQQLDDEDHQERRDAERSLREARDDFRYEQEQAARFDELKKTKGKKK